jgi:periplasmic protein TonB
MLHTTDLTLPPTSTVLPGRRRLPASAAAAASLLAAGCSVLPSGSSRPPLADASYRLAVANHIYRRYPDRIYRGKLPPMLYAIGVLELELDRSGGVDAVRWLRGPSHAPEVMAEIDRLVRQAAPFPNPPGWGRVRTVDTWLWDRSGRFQLDTLSEGQL